MNNETKFPLNVPIYHDIFFREPHPVKEKSHLEIMFEDNVFSILLENILIPLAENDI